MNISGRRIGAAVIGGVLAAGIVFPATGAAASGPNLMVNGSFESPDIPTGTFAIFPSIPGWDFLQRPGHSSTGIEIQDHVAGDPAVRPPGAIQAGDQFAELDSDGSSTYYQDVPTQPGETYRFEFLYSPRPNTAPEDNIFRAAGGDTSVVIGPLASGPETMWSKYAFTFVADADTSRIRFEDLSAEEPVGGVGAYVDRVSVRRVP